MRHLAVTGLAVGAEATAESRGISSRLASWSWGAWKAAAPPADALGWAASFASAEDASAPGGYIRARLFPRGGIPRGVVVREVETARAAHLRGGGDKLPGEHALRAGLGLSVGHRDEHARGKLWGPAPIYRRGMHCSLGDQSKS